jgi:uncharacterized membrane protein YdjX (TVP38/TMEM64 family)
MRLDSFFTVKRVTVFSWRCEMYARNNGLKRLVWVLMGLIFSTLCLSVAGGLLEIPWLTYFWFAALLGIVGISVLSILLLIGQLWGRLVHSYLHKVHHRGDGVPGH